MTAAPTSPPAPFRYPALDGLRGIAALLVIAFHLFEAHARGDVQRQLINHGYLAVDFFFLLSGFVVANAYDDRWSTMSIGEFVRRRLIRLQPMVVLGTVTGALLFAVQTPAPSEPPSTAHLALVMLLGAAMIPLAPGSGLRPGDSLFPLNGPAWSLFYEYVANALYAFGVRNASNRLLAILVGLSALAVARLAVLGPRGDLVGGWMLDGWGVHIGLTRVMFPFFAGILLRRTGPVVAIRHGFAVSAFLLVAALAVPRLGGTDRLWLNGLYETGCVLLLFPLIVAIGAGSTAPNRAVDGLGELSYPLYITHYPLAGLYSAWVEYRQPSTAAGLAVGLAVFAAMTAIAYASLRFYDIPLRRRLSQRFATPPASRPASDRRSRYIPAP